MIVDDKMGNEITDKEWACLAKWLQFRFDTASMYEPQLSKN